MVSGWASEYIRRRATGMRAREEQEIHERGRKRKKTRGGEDRASPERSEFGVG